MDHQQTGSNAWMWTPTPTTKRKLDCYESWEERAFAEDAAGVLGSSGCVWPPRSYTCSFCRREFKSAQALGGHMNVHRRDRARLKQLPNTPQDQSPNYKKFPTPNLSTFVYDTSRNPNFSHALLPSKEGSNGVGNHKSSRNSSFMQVCDFSSPSFSSANFRPNYGKRDARIIELECRDREIEGDNLKCVDSELSVSVNLVVRRSHPDEESSCFKRRKLVATSPEGAPSTPLIFLSKSDEVTLSKSKINIAPREIDLELRLGG